VLISCADTRLEGSAQLGDEEDSPRAEALLGAVFPTGLDFLTRITGHGLANPRCVLDVANPYWWTKRDAAIELHTWMACTACGLSPGMFRLDSREVTQGHVG
jgi:hypothetical protein